jgi:alpha-N-acetylglucosamine transferase
MNRVFFVVTVLLSVSVVLNAGYRQNKDLAKTIQGACKAYGFTKDKPTCKKIALEYVARFDIKNKNLQKSMVELCTYSCDVTRAQKIDALKKKNAKKRKLLRK